MSPDRPSEVEIQTQYYIETAHQYNDRHVQKKGEHELALSFMIGMIDYLEITSILDVGSGTGRVVSYLAEKRPDLRVMGIEPVKALRDIGHTQGIPKDLLVDGNALNIPFAPSDFDLVCSFGVLHHIRTPDMAVSEMLRVAGKAVFISDANNFGQGTFLGRTIKQGIDMLGLWKAANWIKTKGKGYAITEGDGLAYSYSVFNNYKQIQKACEKIHVLNTIGGGANVYRTAGHMALLGIKTTSP